MNLMKEGVISCLENMISENKLRPVELKPFIKEALEITNPEQIRLDLQEWYKCSGLEQITGEKINLSQCPFTEDEIKKANNNNEIILCIPKNVTRVQLAKTFHFDNWAIHDKLVTLSTETEDFWFKTTMKLEPTDMKITGLDLVNKCTIEQKASFSLERYMVFIARIRYLLGTTPDQEYWIWIPRGRYDRSGMLIAGFDRFGEFNVHGWMPQFSASFLGGRFGILPESMIKV